MRLCSSVKQRGKPQTAKVPPGLTKKDNLLHTDENKESEEPPKKKQ